MIKTEDELKAKYERPGSGFDFIKYFRARQAWSVSTFGIGYSQEAILNHARKEIEEIAADPSDPKEWMDLACIALDGLWRSQKLTPKEIAELFVTNFDKCRSRTWPNPRDVPVDTPIEHYRKDQPK